MTSKFKTLLGFLISINLLIACQVGKQHTSVSSKPFDHVQIQNHTAEIFPSLVKLRNDIYAHPESSGYEERTSNLVANYLRELGLEVKTNIGGYGVVGVLNPRKPGRSVAWRADMDAVSQDEHGHDLEAPIHLCGHDIHTVVGLGIANTLSQYADQIDGSVYFLFQPAEESYTGALAMLEDNLFKIFQPDEIYAAHIVPMESGLVSAKANEVYTYRRPVRISFENIEDVQTLEITINEIMHSLQRSKPNTTPWKVEGMLDVKKGIANPDNDFQNYRLLNQSIKIEKKDDQHIVYAGFIESDTNMLKPALVQLEQAIKKSRFRKNLLSTEYVHKIPTVFNNKQLVQQTINTIQSVYGEQAALEHYGVIPYFNDDFAFFQEKIPGVYFFLGGSNFTEDKIAMPHSTDFAVDEKSIEVGVSYFASMLMERVNQY